jgi:hypothetical protein
LLFLAFTFRRASNLARQLNLNYPINKTAVLIAAALTGLEFATLRRVIGRTPSGPLILGPSAVLLRFAYILSP